MRYITLISVLLLCSMCRLYSFGQTKFNKGVIIEDAKAMRVADSLVVEMRVLVERKAVRSNKMITIRPQLVSNEREQQLPVLEVAGRSRYFSNERNGVLATSNNAGVSFRNKRHKDQAVLYKMSVPYSEWMAYSQLVVNNDECGCNNAILGSENAPMGMVAMPTQQLPLRYVYILDTIPITRKESGSAFIIFPVNSTRIIENLANNKYELDKIARSVRNTDTKTEAIQGINLKGYGSPEGPYALNAKLAKGRAGVVGKYITQQLHVPAALVTTSFEPEDWKGLGLAIANGTYQPREQLLAIVNSADSPEVKERKLKLLDGGAPYKVLLREVFPTLRRTDYTINYTVKGYDINALQTQYATNAKSMSLQQLNALAAYYGPQSEKFKSVTSTIINTYPNDTAAFVNAANLAMEAGDYSLAEQLLKKAGTSPQATATRGALALRLGDLLAASQLLSAAANSGVVEAQYNLQLLEQMVK
ncbi:MAG: DUF3868 domain-containing protein [Marinifilaceae bacterium]